ncbi:putative ABC transporter ATP-binding protein [Lactococcus lactis]|nr:Lipid A export ATP-binding/permease protein MsbA [Lactococcus lactis subsp. lactis]MDU0409641.1 putative ABC transporter ATP-binding protein [Lactococcus lactis]
MINLLERFYDVTSGKILLEGKDIREIDREQLRGRMAMVLQETWLFSGTIMDNLQYGRLEATQEEVIQAAKMAHADEFITTLPQGYQTLLNEAASNISQGQRQLLTIARAFLANPEILILDEATSSVDTRTERLIQSAMNRLLKGRTSFVVAHRLSTIRDANQILVMENGNIVEMGNHESLLKENGLYASLYNSQFAK